MKTNIREIARNYTLKLGEGIYKDLNTMVILNAKKAKKGCASVNISITVDENKFLHTTMYIIERKNCTTVMVVNDNTHDIIFNNNRPDAVEKSMSYIDNYIYRCTCKMLNIQIDDELSKADK